MNGLFAALWTEGLKVRKSKIFIITIIFYLFIAVMMGILMYATMHPDIAGRSAALNAKTSFVKDSSWASYFNLLFQVILTMGTIGIGIITSWIFGREYSDRVIKDILALPVSRLTIVLAKYLIIFGWNLILTFIFFCTALLMGLLINITGWNIKLLETTFFIFMATALLNSLLCTLVSFVSSLGRGFLLSIGFVVLTLMIPQFVMVAAPGFAIYVPWAIPAFYCNIAGSATPDPGFTGYLVYCIAVIIGLSGTFGWWRFADQK